MSLLPPGPTLGSLFVSKGIWLYLWRGLEAGAACPCGQCACWSPKETRGHSLCEDQHPSEHVKVNYLLTEWLEHDIIKWSRWPLLTFVSFFIGQQLRLRQPHLRADFAPQEPAEDPWRFVWWWGRSHRGRRLFAWLWHWYRGQHSISCLLLWDLWVQTHRRQAEVGSLPLSVMGHHCFSQVKLHCPA